MREPSRPPRRALRIGFAVAVIAYLSLWGVRREVGLVQPMANLRYFHFGTEPGSFSDRALYVLFLPVYGASLLAQSWRGDRDDVHWSDRRDPVMPSQEEVEREDTPEP